MTRRLAEVISANEYGSVAQYDYHTDSYIVVLATGRIVRSAVTYWQQRDAVAAEK